MFVFGISKGRTKGIVTAEQSFASARSPFCNPAVSRHAPAQALTPASNGRPDRHEQEVGRIADPMRSPSAGSVSGVTWDFAKIPLFPPHPTNRSAAQSAAPLSPINSTPSNLTAQQVDDPFEAPPFHVPPVGEAKPAARELAPPLDPVIPDFSKPAVGHDFRRLRIHANSRAEATTSRPEAAAMTQDVKSKAMPGSVQADLGAATPAYEGCNLTAKFSSIPSGSIEATMTGSSLGAAFTMIGDFDIETPCVCTAGEYRQLVRGTLTRDGAPIELPLGGGRKLHPTNFQEDGDVAEGTVYGHRSVRGTKSKFTMPDQMIGCRFEGADEPGIEGGMPGTRLAMNMDFQGSLIDTSKGKTLAAASWNVSGSGVI